MKTFFKNGIYVIIKGVSNLVLFIYFFLQINAVGSKVILSDKHIIKKLKSIRNIYTIGTL